MSLSIDVQSWYSATIIKEILTRPEAAYKLLQSDPKKFITNIKNTIIKDATTSYIHPKVVLNTESINKYEYFIFDIPVVDKSSDKQIFVAAQYHYKERLFKKELISVLIYRIIQEFETINVFEVTGYISLGAQVLLNAKTVGFLKVDSIHQLLESLASLQENEYFTSNWLWHQDIESEEDGRIYFEKFQGLDRKYIGFEDKALFQEIRTMLAYKSLFISSIFSMFGTFRIADKESCENMKNEFLKVGLANQCIFAMFLGLDQPWDRSIVNQNYYFEIRKLLNFQIYNMYKYLQQYLQMLPKGNIPGLVELSYEAYGIIRSVIEWGYWYGSEFALKKA